MPRQPNVVRLGVAGCGAITTGIHLPNLEDIAGVRVTAVADPDPDALARALHLVPDAHAMADWKSLLERDNVDAVLIALPAQLHAEAALAALRAGRHLYLELPVATDAGTALAVRTEAGNTDTVSMVGFNYRFNPLFEQLRDVIRAGVVGEVAAIRTVFSTHGSPVGWRAELDACALLDLGIHHIDLVRFIAGRQVDTVSAAFTGTVRADDTVALTLQLEDGVVAQSVFCSAGPEHDAIEIIGRKGVAAVRRYESVAVELRGPDAVLARRDQFMNVVRAVRAAPYLRDKLSSPGSEPSFGLALDHFVQAVLSGDPPEAGIDDGVEALAIVDAAIRSARSGSFETVEHA